MSTSVAERTAVSGPKPGRWSGRLTKQSAAQPNEDRKRSWFGPGISYGSSLLIHLLLILLLATILIAMPARQPDDLGINAAIHADQGGGEPLGAVPFEAPLVDKVGAPNLSDVAVAASQESLSGSGGSGSSNPVSLAGANLGAAGGGSGNGKGGPNVGFFGTREAGSTFVFVVDSSGSMRGERFQRALSELRKSIKDLKSWQKFTVIFYNDIPIPLFSPQSDVKLYPSTSAQRAKANKWMQQMTPDGGTQPAEALKKALDMKPDVIFFLTDGEIPEETREAAKAANRHSTIVHTIAFESRDGETILKGIAEDNRGRYRYVR